MQLFSRTFLTILCLTGAAFAGSFTARAQERPIVVEQPHARMTIPGRPAAGYMTIRNKGSKADALVSASSPFAKRIELHTHLMEGGIMKMREVEKVDVPAGGSAEFSPGGDHLMIFGLGKDVKVGDALPVTLSFRDGGKVEVDFEIGKVGDPSRPYAGDGKKDGHQHHGHHKH